MKVKLRPRTKPPQQRRDELMDAAQRLFLKQGVGPTTIDQITSGADVAKGTFYLHFSSMAVYPCLLCVKKVHIFKVYRK